MDIYYSPDKHKEMKDSNTRDEDFDKALVKTLNELEEGLED